MTIWKFQVQPHEPISMPVGAKILCVQLQHGEPMMWALVDENAPKKAKQFHIFGTGFDVPQDIVLNYVGTFQVVGGSLVFHVFEEV